jgi:hypothetical protein
MKKISIAAAAIVSLGLAGSALADQHLTDANASAPDSAANVNDNASDLGKERAERNSAGGDREKGAFGQAQSDFVRSLPEGTNFGQFLKEGGWTGSAK